MPRRLQIEFSQVIQKIADETGKEISPSDIWDTFQDTYLADSGKYEFIDHSVSSTANKDGIQTDEIDIGLNLNGKKISISGFGNGRSAMINALNDLELDLKVSIIINMQ